MASTNVLAFGASRNIGYFSAVRLLEKGATVTFLLRSPSAFDSDVTIQKYIKSGHARLVKGDASIEADTQRAWNEAGVVDAVIFSVGTYPTFHLTKGFVQTPANLVCQCLLNVLCTMQTYPDAPQPKMIIISSTGLTPSAHKELPVLLKPLYGVVLAAPHKDKIGMERAIAHCAGWTWDQKTDGPVEEEILGEGWMQRKGLPPPGSLKRMLVIRPALLTDGKCEADEAAAKGKGKVAYRVSEKELGGYMISRKDTAHFVVDALTRWDEFGNKRVNISY
ncbi:NAD(P)-bd-dom domain-containing protein [Mycena venus]|uniref:NAD(P)-bd-dom domain-containing protein n=1 Tax=Mycena venus TaxID=2733690 RepID=A0A8H6YMY5_9AGAR|nr:NAD(P)-bd-dom domain-containing protein [Mycena venus]